MKKQTDLRVIRTKFMIKNAFLELMEEIGFTKITVEGITQKAFISRNTFYLHYADKYDLLNTLEDEVLLGIKDIVKEMPIEIMKRKGFADSRPFSILIRIYQYIRDNSRFFSLMINENGDPCFLHKLSETIKSVINQNNMEEQLKIPSRYMIAIIAGIQTSIIGEWLRSGMKETPEELAELIAAIFESAPKNLLKPSQ
ncbi:TetR/AcrR family transcriptional regulator [Anaerocolumna xylanovorans]|uniref:Transcriptional regulator, TetR family n=1 Tax=Anaerocolumna xylanovorans DSM 12503 TaxID=1121345 RepID=A0A1M7YMQ3_9FIRM|nr:TetR/AcrR family transcriptional regulator [Anaerocolumna xylanovorans]SHO53806.1 transcriptional regulator, TetR family [Anaerocolumna xylanovorans DSM 12503]